MEADCCIRIKTIVFFWMLCLSIWPQAVRSESLSLQKALSFRLQLIPPRSKNAITGSDTEGTGMPDYKSIGAQIFPAKGQKVLSVEELLKKMVEGS